MGNLQTIYWDEGMRIAGVVDIDDISFININHPEREVVIVFKSGVKQLQLNYTATGKPQDFIDANPVLF